MIKVLLVDDHEIVVDGLRSILEGVRDMEVVGTALNAAQGLELMRRMLVDVAVLDIEMPGQDGIQMAKRIKEQFPETKVLILSMYKKKDMVNGVLDVGGDGYILKNRGKQELEIAIRRVANGEHHWGSQVTQVMIHGITNPAKEKQEKSPLLAPLTERELEVLRLVVDGKTSQQIADELFVTKATVSTHRQHIRAKMGVPSKAVIKFALDHNLV